MNQKAVFRGGPWDGLVKDAFMGLGEPTAGRPEETPIGIYDSSDDLDDQGRVIMRWRPVGCHHPDHNGCHVHPDGTYWHHPSDAPACRIPGTT